MSKPYEILGIQPNASNEAVKEAYKEKLQHYQQYRFSGTPEAAEAERTIVELNQAYDEIMVGRTQQSTQGATVVSYQTGPSGKGSADSQFLDVRRMIQASRMNEAEELLEGVPLPSRDAEWYFLKGSVQYSRGRLEDAYENFDRAVKMDPENQEYQATISQLRWQRQTGRTPQGAGQGAGSSMGCSVCDVCTTLYCANCCCQCIGRDCF